MLIQSIIVAAAIAKSPQPNIVVFLVDDLGWQDTSVPFHSEVTPFNERYNTPNWQRLADNGTKYTNAYAAGPVCTPSRTSLLTGQSPARTHITYWTLYKNVDNSKKTSNTHCASVGFGCIATWRTYPSIITSRRGLPHGACWQSASWCC